MKLKSNTSNLSMPRPFDPSNLLLSAVTDSEMNKKWGYSVSDAVKAAVEGGATIIQLREKEAETRDDIEAAKACLEICHSHGVPLLINDRIDVALACDTDGVHIRQSDMPAQALLGPDLIIGVTCKTPIKPRKHGPMGRITLNHWCDLQDTQKAEAWTDGADYIGFGGVFPTNTKENNPTERLAGLKTMGWTSKLPVVAIGGIGNSNVKSVLELVFQI